MSILCLIPARAGSKGVPAKNLRRAGGLSLVARAVWTAREFARLVEPASSRVVVDTDGESIASEARQWGAEVPFLRPAALAGDEASTIDATLHMLDRIDGKCDAVVLLQPTSPTRAATDILQCWSMFLDSRAPSVATVSELHLAGGDFSIDASGVLAAADQGADLRRRQEYLPHYGLTGSVYVVTPEFLRENRAFVKVGITRGVPVPAERSVDVDTLVDLGVAESILAARATPVVRLGSVSVGGGSRCFVVAEAGVNHNGDPALAHRLVDAAAEAGADAVKFQTFEPDLLVSPRASKASYQTAATGSDESQLEMLRSLTLPAAVFTELASHAAERGLMFLSTAFDEPSADLVDSLGVPAFKIPSGEITNHAFLATIARRGKPILVSTGMSAMHEVAAALDVIRRNGDPDVVLLHAVTEYPADPAECNLRAMDSMRGAFNVPVGWSDHTEGIDITLAAVALGAEVIEKHFTLGRHLPGPDHAASLEPAELRDLVAGIRRVEASRGDGVKAAAASEKPNRAVVRRSLHAALPLEAGHVLREGDLVALRPGTGISAADLGRVVGRKLRSGLHSGDVLLEAHLE